MLKPEMPSLVAMGPADIYQQHASAKRLRTIKDAALAPYSTVTATHLNLNGDSKV